MGIEIQFLGAVGTVTGSQFLVRAGDRRVLVDCGMFQGAPDEVSRNRLPFAFPPGSLDAVLLTHAHLDHCGRVPALVRAGFHGPIYTTSASAELTGIVLRDSAKLQAEAEARWRRKHPEEAAAHDTELASEDAVVEGKEGEDDDLPARLRGAEPVGTTMTRAALYDERDVEQTVRQFREVDYGQMVEVATGVHATFHDAGHILGSAIIELRVSDGRQQTTAVFSGDLGRNNTPILRDPTPVSHADFVLVESTYGDREHAPHEEAIDDLVAAIGEVSEGSGVLLVPSFAIGRSQEVIWVLDHLLREGRIERLPLFIDSPMASRASEVYRKYPNYYDEQTRRLMQEGESPLEYPGEAWTDTPDESKAIRTRPRPFMIVASSGMLTGGRIMHHLKDFLPDPASTLLFIGYQGEGTLGRHIQGGGKTARIDGEEYPVRCRVRSISGFSAHADENELAAWLGHFTRAGGTDGSDGQPKRVFIVHGDPEAAEAFAQRIGTEMGLETHIPRYRETVALR